MFRQLPAYTRLFVKIFGLYLLVFFTARLVFCLFNQPEDTQESLMSYVQAYLMGLRFDLLVVSFFTMLPAVLLFVHQGFLKHWKWLVYFSKWYLALGSLFLFFIACADIPYYSQFGSHINKSVMVWRLSADYTLKLVFSSFYYWGFFLLFLLISAGWLVALNDFFKRYQQQVTMEQSRAWWKNSLLILLTAFVLFAFARGRLSSKSTMHEGMAIVGQNAFVNQIALNANFTLMKSLSRKDQHTADSQVQQGDLRYCKRFYSKNFFPERGRLLQDIKASTPVDSLRRFNVVLVLMESLNMSKMGFHGHENQSPYLTQLAGESVFFDRFFSSGIHTFNGLFSSTSGFPSYYTDQGLRQYTHRPFATLANLLKPYGYQSYFCTTHDAVFDNMEGFFKLNGFENIISESDFSMSESIGVTGVPDHLLYAKLVERLNARPSNENFVAFVMTGTDHGPWHIPDNIPFKPSGESYQENASRYADWAVRQFIEQAKQQAWYANTVFVFLGDHGQIMEDPYQMPITYHHTPCIIHCPAILKSELNHHLAYQPDLLPSIASLLNLRYTNFSFGVNMFTQARPFIFFSADDKLGYVTDDDYFFFHSLSDNVKRFVKYQSLDKTDYYSQYRSRADSLYRLTCSLYNSAGYYLHNNYSSY